MSPIVTLFLQLIAALPSELAVLQNAYQAIKADLSANDAAEIEAAFDAANARIDADMGRFDADAAAHGG